MGRNQQDSARRSDRAKQAKETVTKVIPELLRSSPRVRHGVHNARLVVEPSACHSDAASSDPHSPIIRIRLRNTDALTAARQLNYSSRRASLASTTPGKTFPNGKAYPNVCILNMASSSRPGGAFLDGVPSPEEFLCMRTTLFPSLWHDFYHLPDVGGILTPDVLVFRESNPEAEDLSKRDRFFVDVVSAGMRRFPGGADTAGRSSRDHGAEEDGVPCSCGITYCNQDRELVTRKMQAVLRMAQARGSKKLVLGAWGCGAYGNPVLEVAKLWRKVLLGTNREPQSWNGFKEIVFAIPDRGMLKVFERVFADVLAPANATPSPPPEISVEPSATINTSDRLTDLVSKIQETEIQLDCITNPRSKARLRDTLASLNRQLADIGSVNSLHDELPPEDEDGENVGDDNAVDATMSEENSYYNFDPDDIPSSGSASPASLYEFRIRSLSSFDLVEEKNLPPPETPSETRFSSLQQDAIERQKLQDNQGWFNGSINGLTALLKNPIARHGAGSPVLRPDSMASDVEDLTLESYLHKFLA